MIARLELTYADGTTRRRRHRPRAGASSTARRSPTTGTRAPTTTRARSRPAGTSRALTSRGTRPQRSARRRRAAPSSSGARRRRYARAEDVQARPDQAVPSPARGRSTSARTSPGMPQLHVKGVPAGTTIKMVPAELLSGERHGQPVLDRPGTGILDTYTTDGDAERDVRRAVHVPRLPVRAGHRPARRLRARREHARRPADQRRRPDRRHGHDRRATRSTRSTGCREYSIRSTCSRSSPTARTARSSAGSRT